MKQLESVSRVDLVWDVYVADSLEKSAIEKSGIGALTMTGKDS